MIVLIVPLNTSSPVGLNPVMKPTHCIIGGCNGAGKNTLAAVTTAKMLN